MIKDFLISFKDNINTKTSNPFFGTLILVWITKNWNLFYSIFNFDKNITLDGKRDFILAHFIAKPFIKTLLWSILEAFIVLLISYILINLTRLIINFFEKKITPLVYEWTDENSVVLKSIYENSENDKKRLEKRVEEERDAKLKLQDEYDKLEKRLAELLTKNVSNKTNDNGLPKKINPKSSSDSKTQLLMNKLKKENKIDSFERIASIILNDISIEKSKEVQEFTTLGLLKPGTYHSNDRYRFSLTNEGQNLQNKLVMEKLK